MNINNISKNPQDLLIIQNNTIFMSNIKELDKKSFDEFISKGNAIVDFWAIWCGPCKIMEPHYEAAAKEAKNVKFAKIDVDKNQEIAERFEVLSIPTTIFFKNKEQVDRVIGAISKEDILGRIKENFK